jgi:hypothetical protein
MFKKWGVIMVMLSGMVDNVNGEHSSTKQWNSPFAWQWNSPLRL